MFRFLNINFLRKQLKNSNLFLYFFLNFYVLFLFIKNKIYKHTDYLISTFFMFFMFCNESILKLNYVTVKVKCGQCHCKLGIGFWGGFLEN